MYQYYMYMYVIQIIIIYIYIYMNNVHVCTADKVKVTTACVHLLHLLHKEDHFH